MTTCLGKSCSFWLPRGPFVICCQFMYLVISLLVLRAGCGIWLIIFLLFQEPYKARFIANSSYRTTTELSKLLTHCLTAVKNYVIRYCEKVYEMSGKSLFWSIKNFGEILNKLKWRGFRAPIILSTYDFSTLYTTLPHNKLKWRGFRAISLSTCDFFHTPYHFAT